ncbi:MAG: asparagine synthase (glutamine-hydrolyzing) [Candidatus Hydrogenedentota bacterium]
MDFFNIRLTMCGINGIISFKRNLDTHNRMTLLKMNSALKNRGPDGIGVLEANTNGRYSLHYHNELTTMEPVNFCLGHTRLAIIDLSYRGLQPLSNEDNTVFVVYNGEIYNYIELREELLKRGHIFRSKTDTEVIAHSYEEYGYDCVNRFNGMWAFALFDLNNMSFFCSRDRFGIKPLYYYYDRHYFIFSSEIRTILFNKVVRKELNIRLFFEYLASGVRDYCEETLYDGIYRLLPAHNLVLDRSGIKIYRYWDINGSIDTGISFNEACKKYRELLVDSVNIRLKNSDVEVASCLSGGLDSSSMVSIISDMFSTEKKIKTFSYCAGYDYVDESCWVDHLLKEKSIMNYKIFITKDDLLQHYENMLNHFDEMLIIASCFSEYMVMREIAANNIKVTLDGQGGDELLSGYTGYISYHIGNLRRDQAKIYCDNYGLDYDDSVYALGYYKLFKAVPRFFDIFKYLTNDLLMMYENNYCNDWLVVKNFKGENVEKKCSKYLVLNKDSYSFRLKQKFESPLKNYLYNDLTLIMLPALLRYEDTISMAHSIEARVPFLDYRLVEFINSLPDEYILNKGLTKYISRQSMKNIVPATILSRIDKKGYSTPDREWLQQYLGQYFYQKISGNENYLKDYFNTELIRNDLISVINTVNLSPGSLVHCLSGIDFLIRFSKL